MIVNSPFSFPNYTLHHNRIAFIDDVRFDAVFVFLSFLFHCIVYLNVLYSNIYRVLIYIMLH